MSEGSGSTHEASTAATTTGDSGPTGAGGSSSTSAEYFITADLDNPTNPAVTVTNGRFRALRGPDGTGP